MRKNIDGDVDFFAAGVDVLHRFAQLVAVEIVGERAQSVVFIRKINGIRAEVQSRFQSVEVPCRRK